MFVNVASPKLSNSAHPIALLCAVLLVAGCAPQHAVQLPDIDNWESRTELLSNLRGWEFSGRIAVKSGEEGINARIRWEQQGNSFTATLNGPLGIGTVRIDGDGRSVVHTDKDGVRTELDNAEADLYYRYGWTIPVSSLSYWALGIPDPALPAQTDLNSDHQLAKLQQRDWTVTIQRYRISGGQPMPRLLLVNNLDTRIRIVIDKWFFFD